MSETIETETSPRFFSGRKVAAIVIVITLVAGTAGVMWWRQQHNFCDQVADLPDITNSMTSTGSPGTGLLDYASQLDKIASIAPDAETKSAAQTLAAAQRTVGEALAGNTIASSVPGALAALDTSAVSAAESQFQQTIASRCHS